MHSWKNYKTMRIQCFHQKRKMQCEVKTTEEKKVSQESMAVQMAALLLGACVCSCVHVCMYVYGHVFTCVRVQ